MTALCSRVHCAGGGDDRIDHGVGARRDAARRHVKGASIERRRCGERGKARIEITDHLLAAFGLLKGRGGLTNVFLHAVEILRKAE